MKIYVLEKMWNSLYPSLSLLLLSYLSPFFSLLLPSFLPLSPSLSCLGALSRACRHLAWQSWKPPDHPGSSGSEREKKEREVKGSKGGDFPGRRGRGRGRENGDMFMLKMCRQRIVAENRLSSHFLSLFFLILSFSFSFFLFFLILSFSFFSFTSFSHTLNSFLGSTLFSMRAVSGRQSKRSVKKPHTLAEPYLRRHSS